MTKPFVVAGLLLLAGTGLAVGGVFMLAGSGWALVAAAVPCLALSIVIARGARE